MGEPRGCCHGAEHRFGTGVNKEQAGQDRTDLGVPLLRDVLPSPQRLRSSLPCSSPPLLMSHWEMSAEHPAALSPPGCTSCSAPARGAARSGTVEHSHRVSPGIFLLVSHGEDSSKMWKVSAALKICLCLCTAVFLASSGSNRHTASERPERPGHSEEKV